MRLEVKNCGALNWWGAELFAAWFRYKDIL